MIKHIIKRGASLDLGTRAVTGALTGTHARVRIGAVDVAARLELLSTGTLDGGFFEWVVASGGASATLRLDLHQDQLALVGPGEWRIELDAIRDTGEVLPIAVEELIIRPSILPATGEPEEPTPSRLTIPQMFSQGVSGAAGAPQEMFLGGVTNLSAFRVPSGRVARVIGAQFSAISTSGWGAGTIRLGLEVYRSGAWVSLWSDDYTEDSDEVVSIDVTLAGGELLRPTVQILSGTVSTIIASCAFVAVVA